MIVHASRAVSLLPDGAIRVILEPWERDAAVAVATGRLAANAGTGDARHYDRARMQDDMTAEVAGVACEMATAKALNLYWSPSVWPRRDHARHADLPDIAPDIEVRRVRDRANPLAVRRRDHDRDRAMVLAYAAADGTVELLGWCRAADQYPNAPVAPWDRTGLTHLVAQHLLTPFVITAPTWGELARVSA